MSLPYRHHILWQLIEDRSDSDITAFYDNIQLPKPTAADLSQCRDKLSDMVIPPFALRNIKKDKVTAADVAVWNKLGFSEIYAKRTGDTVLELVWLNVSKLLNNPVMRVAIDCGLLVGLQPEELSQMASQSFGTGVDDAVLALYRKYFFDCGSFLKSDWRNYLRALQEDTYTHQRIYAALTKPRDEVLFMVGLPNKRQFSDFLRNVLATSDYKFRYYARQNNQESDDESRKWAKVGFDAGVRLEKFSATDATDFSKLVQTEFEYITPQILTISPEMLNEVRPPSLEDDDGKPKSLNAPAAPLGNLFPDNESI